jgi:hypothetical protein
METIMMTIAILLLAVFALAGSGRREEQPTVVVMPTSTNARSSGSGIAGLWIILGVAFLLAFAH